VRPDPGRPAQVLGSEQQRAAGRRQHHPAHFAGSALRTLGPSLKSHLPRCLHASARSLRSTEWLMCPCWWWQVVVNLGGTAVSFALGDVFSCAILVKGFNTVEGRGKGSGAGQWRKRTHGRAVQGTGVEGAVIQDMVAVWAWAWGPGCAGRERFPSGGAVCWRR